MTGQDLVKNERKRTVPLTQFIASMVIFGTIGIIRKFIPLGSGTLVVCRGLLGSLFILLVISLRKNNPKEAFGLKKVLIFILTGMLMGGNWIVLFEAYNYTTVSTATMCYYMQPAFLIVLSVLFLREKITKKKIICILVSILGMVFVSGVLENDGASASNYTGIALGLLSGLMYAVVVIINKKFPAADSLKKTIVQLASSLIVAIPYAVLNEDVSSIYNISGVQIVLVLVLGLVNTGLACALYFTSIEKIPSSSMAVLGYLDPGSALVLSAVVLGEPISALGVVGAVLILGSALVSERKKS